MQDIRTICPNPACDKDIVLLGPKVLRAILRKDFFDGHAVIGCPECAVCMVLQADIPADPSNASNLFGAYVASKNFDDPLNWCGCVPWLDNKQLILPSGYRLEAGSLRYIPGDGSAPLDKYAYEKLYGIDPEIANNIGRVAKKPFKIGD